MGAININHLRLGTAHFFGHEVYPDAVYDPSVERPQGEKEQPMRVIFKRNKFGQQQLSRYEVAFSQLARLFLAKNLTAPQHLVTNEFNNVLGLMTEHLCYSIENKEGLSSLFYTLNNADTLRIECTAKKVATVEEIPLYFLNQVPHSFFAHLLQAEKKGQLTIDYTSLASILTSAYSLEEDDLHKGNFGFYLVDKQGTPEVVFFKIDHDLMFVDSIMSFCTSRITHLFQGEDAFDVTEYDLLHFPEVKSANFYWPTKKKTVNPWDSKEYHQEQEVAAFSGLKDIPAFQKAKWMSWYKHILIPTELIELSLRESLDHSNPANRAHIALLVQATVARQARLRAYLFSLKEFRDVVVHLTAEEQHALLEDSLHTCPLSQKTAVSTLISQRLSAYETQCKQHYFTEGDTPLHTAIKLGDFRYEESMQMFGQFVNTRNALGQRPIDIALAMIPHTEEHPTDVRQDLRFTMKYLLKHGALVSERFKQFNDVAQVEHYQFHTPYMNRAAEANSYDTLKTILRDVGEDSHYCLKFKKNLAIECVAQFIQKNSNNPYLQGILLRLKSDINNSTEGDETAGLRYIRQLRSRLWIVRQIRGLYGWTSTQGEIDALIDRGLEHCASKKTAPFSFFNSAPVDTPDELNDLNPGCP